MMIPPVSLSSRALPAHQGRTSKFASCNRVARRVQAASTATEEAPAQAQLQLSSAPHPHPVLSAVSGTRAWATQLWTGIRRGDGASAASDVLDKASLVIETAERAQEVEEVMEESRAKSRKVPPKDISHLLRTTGLMEMRYIRQMASMCAQTYYLSKLSARTVFRRYGLRLVTTSRAWEPSSDVHTDLTAGQVACDGDGMAATTAASEQSREQLEETAVKAEAPAAMGALAALEKSDRRMSPADLVATKLAAAFVAAAAAASPLTSPFNSLTSSMPVQVMASSLQVAASAGHSTAAATLGMVFAAVESIWSRDKAKHAPPKSRLSSPTEWYVCDDAASQTRFFVLQGSDTVDHWRVNVTFDPIPFEDPELNVKIHRGVYDAAQILYERFLPLVTEHLKRSRSSKIVFTGHSLGGSLATVLMLMYVRRGVIPVQAVSPIYTFGAPAVFCEASACGCACSLPLADTLASQPASSADGSALEPAAPSASSQSSTSLDAPAYELKCEVAAEGHFGSAVPPPGSSERALPQSTAAAFEATGTEQDGLLAAVGVPPSAIRNVLMHKDLVPRAFACDYRLVADLLRRVNESFREHACLSGTGRVVMYSAVGTTLILQPDSAHTFVREPDHPMLPPGPGLYTLRPPSRITMQVAEAVGVDHPLGAHVAGKAQQPFAGTGSGPQLDAATANNVVPLSAESNQDLGPNGTVKLQRMQKPRAKASTPREALDALMDFPHPLEILAEPRSYGPDGAISRYHDPDSYKRSLGGVISARTRAWRASLSQASPALADAAAAAQQGETNWAAEGATGGPTLKDGPRMQDGENERSGESCPEESVQNEQSAGEHVHADGRVQLEAHASANEVGVTFLSSLPLPWFKRLAEEEGTTVIKVGKRDAAGSQSSAPSPAADPPCQRPGSPRSKLPELHRIQIPSRRPKAAPCTAQHQICSDGATEHDT